MGPLCFVRDAFGVASLPCDRGDFGIEQHIDWHKAGIISDTKLERVRVLLQNRNLGIKDIAPLCGYATVNAMRIAFKNRYGIGLSDVRR